MLLTRLVTMEKTARNLFNKDVSNYKLDDKYMKVLGTSSNVLNADVLSQLARKDLPSALELMSKLKVEGVVTGQTLQKMFTQRHALDMEVFLGQINGDLQGIVNTVTKGKDYMADFEKQMYTFSNQLTLFQNNMKAMGASTIELLKAPLTALLSTFNSVFEGTEKTLTKQVLAFVLQSGISFTYLIKQVVSIGIAVGQLNRYWKLGIHDFSSFVDKLKSGFSNLLSSTTFWATTMIVIFTGIASYIKRTSEETQQAMLKTSQSIKNMTNTLQSSKAMIDAIQSQVTGKNEYVYEFKNITDFSHEQTDLGKQVAELIKKQQNALNSKEEYKLKIQASLDTKKVMEDLKNNIETIKAQRKKALEELLEQAITDKDINNAKSDSYGTKHTIENQQKILAVKYIMADDEGNIAKLDEIRKQWKGLTNERDDINLTKATELANKIKWQSGRSLTIDNEALEQYESKLNELAENNKNNLDYISQYNKDINSMFTITEITANTVNQKLMEQGKFLDPLTLKMYNFKDNQKEILALFQKSFNERWNLKIDYDDIQKAQRELIKLKEELDSIKDKKIRIDIEKRITQKEEELINKQKDYYVQTHSQVDMQALAKKLNLNTKNPREMQKLSDVADAVMGYKVQMAKIEADNKFKTNAEKQEIELTKTAVKNFTPFAAVYDRAVEGKDKIDNLNKAMETYIEFQKADIQADRNSQKKAKSGHKETEYKMEYVKLQERSLALEQAIYLVGKEGLEKEYQQYLNKQQSLKLELDTLKATKERLSLASSKYIQKGTNETDQAFMDRIKARIEEITAMGTLSGKNGQAIKEEQQELSKLYDAYMSYMNKFDNFAINSLSLLEKAIESVKNKQYEALESLISYKKELYSLNKLSDEDYFSALSDTIELTGLKIEDIKSKIKNLNLSLLSTDMQDTVNNIINSDVINKQDLTIYAKLDFEDTKDIEKRLRELQNKQAKGITLTQEEQKELEVKILKLDTELKVREQLKLLQEKQVQKTREELDLIKAKNDIAQKGFSQMASFMKNSGTGKLGAGFGGLFEGLSNYANSMSEQGKNFLSPALQQFMSKMKDLFGRVNADSQVGQALTNALGINNSTSQLFGSLGALGSNLLGFGGPAGMLTSTGLSLLGGIFGRKNKNRQAEADKKSEKARTQYNENTRQLQIVANRLESLNTNLLNLNQSMVSIFSNLPTIDNIARITSGMEKLYGVINVNRDFGNVSYLTQESKTSGNWFTGKSTVTWLENHQLSTQALLKEYGFKGGILDMSIKQLEDFSKWLKTYSKGLENNFKDYAKVVDNYVTSMINLKEMINKFSYKVTFEAFQGFSVSKQEDLIKNLTQIYKDAGITITEGITQQIKELAEQMSVLVTIMSDVRKDFLSQWKDSGKTAGESFVGSMKPYVQALLNNMSQVYFDTVFSNSAKRLELQFKNIGDLLFNLKKQGRDLTWNKIANEMRKPFSNVVDLLREAQERTDTFTSALIGLQKVAREKGMSFSEMSSLNLLTKTQQSMFENFKQGIQSTEMNSALTSVGTLVGNTIGEEMSKRLIDNFMSNKLTDLSEQLDKTLRGNMNLNDLSKISQMAMSTGLQLETERRKLTAIRDMFNFNKDINYQNNNNEIKYETGTSQTVINNFYITGQVNAGVVIPQAEVKQFVQATINDTIEVLNTDKGIDLKKLI